MLPEVFELLIQVHSGMHIVTVGLIDGSKVQRLNDSTGSKETVETIELEKTDIGFAIFKKTRVSSYYNNGQVTGSNTFVSKIAIPYSNISYMEFSDDEE